MTVLFLQDTIAAVVFKQFIVKSNPSIIDVPAENSGEKELNYRLASIVIVYCMEYSNCSKNLLNRFSVN